MPNRPVHLQDDGLLWAINRFLLHGQGFALGVVFGPNGEVTRFELLGDGKEPWRYLPDDDQECAERWRNALDRWRNEAD